MVLLGAFFLLVYNDAASWVGKNLDVSLKHMDKAGDDFATNNLRAAVRPHA